MSAPKAATNPVDAKMQAAQVANAKHREEVAAKVAERDAKVAAAEAAKKAAQLAARKERRNAYLAKLLQKHGETRAKLAMNFSEYRAQLPEITWKQYCEAKIELIRTWYQMRADALAKKAAAKWIARAEQRPDAKLVERKRARAEKLKAQLAELEKELGL